MDNIEKLANKHWNWIEGLLDSLPDGEVFGIETTEYLYKTAFIHGYKHAIQPDVQPDVKLKCPYCGEPEIIISCQICEQQYKGTTDQLEV